MQFEFLACLTEKLILLYLRKYWHNMEKVKDPFFLSILDKTEWAKYHLNLNSL